MNTAARHTGPLPVAEFQATVYLSAGGAGLAACVPATDAHQVDAFPTALVLKNRIEPADACIRDAVGKTVDVYLRIPANRKGQGKVQVSFHGSIQELHAQTDSDVPLPS